MPADDMAFTICDFGRNVRALCAGHVVNRPESLHLRTTQMVAKLLVQAGEVYGRLAVIKEVEPHTGPDGSRFRQFECRCECGATSTVRLRHLRSGNTTSCGCSQKKHGMSNTPTYRAWEGMINRCTNPASTHYHRYGGRGIAVCERWRQFENFFADMGEKPSGLTLERIDNDGNYEGSNCRWATKAEQARNRCDTIILTFNGETMCLTDWARRIGVHPSTLKARLKTWPLEEAMATSNLGMGGKRRI